MSRGQLTDEVKKVSKDKLGYGISLGELRLMPYLQYCLMNGEGFDRGKITDRDRKALSLWFEKGFAKDDGITAVPHLTKEFYRAMCEILMVAYCSEYVG